VWNAKFPLQCNLEIFVSSNTAPKRWYSFRVLARQFVQPPKRGGGKRKKAQEKLGKNDIRKADETRMESRIGVCRGVGVFPMFETEWYWLENEPVN